MALNRKIFWCCELIAILFVTSNVDRSSGQRLGINELLALIDDETVTKLFEELRNSDDANGDEFSKFLGDLLTNLRNVTFEEILETIHAEFDQEIWEIVIDNILYTELKCDGGLDSPDINNRRLAERCVKELSAVKSSNETWAWSSKQVQK